jgi:hypothetical protein
MASRLVQTILAVHSTLSAAPALTTARVALGPVVTGDPSDTVWVGFDGSPDSEFQAGGTSSEWAGLGAARRTEDITVTGAITVLVGDGDVAGALARMDALFDAVDDALRVDPALGQSPTPFVAALKAGELYLEPTTAGLEPRLVFTVTVKSRT